MNFLHKLVDKSRVLEVLEIIEDDLLSLQ